LQQFSERYAIDRTEAPGMLISEKLLGFLRREALNHTQTILRKTLYVNDITMRAAVGAAAFGLRAPGFDFSPAIPPAPRFRPCPPHQFDFNPAVQRTRHPDH